MGSVPSFFSLRNTACGCCPTMILYRIALAASLAMSSVRPRNFLPSPPPVSWRRKANQADSLGEQSIFCTNAGQEPEKSHSTTGSKRECSLT